VIPEQQQVTAPAAVYPAPAAGVVVPYAGVGVPAVQSVVLPDGRVVTGYALTPAGPAVQPPAVVERRGVDPTAQKLAAGGVFALGAGIGGSFLLDALAAAETALGALAVCMVIGWAMRGRGGGGGGGSVRVDVQVSPMITTTATAKVRQ
jgi:hypothetical protein